jgi:DNA replication protein DnaC
MVRQLREAKAGGRFTKKLQTYLKPSVLVLDEVGYFGADVLAAAILDRLLHHCEVISINGPSYRLKDHLAITKGGGPLE